MSWLKNHTTTARAAVIIAMGGLALSACATNGYVDEQIAAVNSRIDQTDQRVASAASRAEAANSAAQAAATEARAANTAAQGAATEARSANQRLDQTNGRIDAMEKAPVRTPRG
jgi:chromosome segregation ATPase